ncbi:MAG: hypothetical protein K0Q79_2318 [Flavipsychrobacter sp.]|jgi:hypothetical protein|nr:hypothetical protein [Flavipsychrobacter sp.]
MIKVSSLVILLFVGIFSATAQTSGASAGKVNTIGPYQLGSDFTELKDLPGFKYDSGRSKPGIGVKVGKIIDKNVYDQPTIQRLTFHKNKLVRISVIIGDPAFTEEQTKALVAKQWGDPGKKQVYGGNMLYVWAGTTGTIMILPADGGRQMITLTDNDKSHYVE